MQDILQLRVQEEQELFVAHHGVMEVQMEEVVLRELQEVVPEERHHPMEQVEPAVDCLAAEEQQVLVEEF
jgi:hypothetical protein